MGQKRYKRSLRQTEPDLPSSGPIVADLIASDHI